MLDTIWREAQLRLRHELSEKDYETWIVPLRPARWTEGEITIEAPSAFFRDWLRRNFLTRLEAALRAASGSPVTVTLEVNRAIALPGAARPVRRRDPLPAALPPPRCTFDNFVVGASNQVAYRAAQAVISQPGARFNPLCFFGGVGLGKTHLLSAVGHAVAGSGGAGRVAFISAETFVNEMIGALQNRRMDRFRRRFRGIETLVVDDIQFLAGKVRSQEEFLHTFNALYDGRKQIVLASDRAPREMPGIEETLRNRFASGLLARIAPPDAALRRALVLRKAETRALVLPPDVSEFLAERWCANVRELEGALTRVDAYAGLSGRPVTLELAREALGVNGTYGGATTERIIRAVCEQCDVTREELLSPRRTARIARARQVAMYLCRSLTELPLERIGAELGGRDHSTVVHSLSVIERRLETDAALRQTLKFLRLRLRA